MNNKRCDAPNWKTSGSNADDRLAPTPSSSVSYVTSSYASSRNHSFDASLYGTDGGRSGDSPTMTSPCGEGPGSCSECRFVLVRVRRHITQAEARRRNGESVRYSGPNLRMPAAAAAVAASVVAVRNAAHLPSL